MKRTSSFQSKKMLSKERSTVRFKHIDTVKEEDSKEEQYDAQNDMNFEARKKIEKKFEDNDIFIKRYYRTM